MIHNDHTHQKGAAFHRKTLNSGPNPMRGQKSVHLTEQKHEHTHQHAHHAHEHHEHAHHRHGAGSGKRALITALILTLGFAGVEFVFGHISGSLALTSDAGHMALDGLTLGLALIATILAARPPTDKHTFGYAKAEGVAGFLSSGLMIGIVVWIIVSALMRFWSPQPVDGKAVLIVGSLGLLVNLLVLWILSRAEGSLSIKAALLHVVGDILGSVSAIGSAILIMWQGWYWSDPVLSLVISALILKSSWALMKQSTAQLVDAVPEGTNVLGVREKLEAIPGVEQVLDLHVWPLTPGQISLSAHIKIAPGCDCQPVLAGVQKMLAEQFGILHSTVQPHEGQVLEHSAFAHPQSTPGICILPAQDSAASLKS